MKDILFNYYSTLNPTTNKEVLNDVLDYILDDRVSIIRIGSLYRFFNEKYTKKDLLKVFFLIREGKYKFIYMVYEFFEDFESDESVLISKQEYDNAEKEGVFVTPKSGEELVFEEFMKHTIFYFSINREELNSIKNETYIIPNATTQYTEGYGYRY